MSEAFCKKSVLGVSGWLEDEGVPSEHCILFEGTTFCQ